MKLITCYNIKGYYLIDTCGNIYSLKSKKTLKQHFDKDGYPRVTLMIKNNKWSPFSVHRLMAETYLSNPSKKREVNHKDSNRKNNNLDNLEWVTYEENQTHGCLLGNRTCGWKKLSKRDVREIFYSTLSHRKLAKIYDVSARTIYGVKHKLVYKKEIEELTKE